MKRWAIILVLLIAGTVQAQAPVIEPDGVPFDPNVGDVLYAQEFEPNESLQLKIGLFDDSNGLNLTCSEGSLNSPDINNITEGFTYEYIWTYTATEGMHYIEFIATDSDYLTKTAFAVIYVASHNQPPVFLYMTLFEPNLPIEPNVPEPNEPNESVIWTKPYSVNDPNNAWSSEGRIIDGDTSTYTVSTVMNEPLEIVGVLNTKCRLFVHNTSRVWNIEIYHVNWQYVYEGGLSLGWNEFTYPDTTVIRIKQISGSNNGALSELEVAG